MITCLTLSFIAGFWVMWTGPAFQDIRAERRARKEFPTARTVFALPSAVKSQDHDAVDFLNV